jgi:DNA invertase Pin-like site-specific DNA recombinase
MNKIGYACLSHSEKCLETQKEALTAAGCTHIFCDDVSAGGAERLGLAEAVASLTQGDLLIVWRLDRLGKSLVHLVALINGLVRNGVEFCSLTENIHSGSDHGREILKVMAALAESERFFISEQTRAGMNAARSQGQHIGRPSVLNRDEVETAVRAVVDAGQAISDVAKRYNVHPRTIRRAIDHFYARSPSVDA